VIGDEEVRKRVGKLRIGERINSDPHPVEVSIKKEKPEEIAIESRRRNRPMRGMWSDEGRELFKGKMKGTSGVRGGNGEKNKGDDEGN